MNCTLTPSPAPAEPERPTDFAACGSTAVAAQARRVSPGQGDSGGKHPPRPRLRRVLGLQMDAFVSEALAGEHPRVLAGRIENIVALTQELCTPVVGRAAAARRQSGELAAILRGLDRQRNLLLAREQAPAGIRHALDPLLVAVLRGELDAR